MRTEEEHFIQILDEISKKELLEKGDRKRVREKEESFCSTVSGMVNSFGFSKKEVLAQISSKKNRLEVFTVLSLYWIQAQADRHRINYLDARDRLSVVACKKITLLPEWENVYRTGISGEDMHGDCLYAAGCYARGMEPFGMHLIGSLYDMHPTNRQTFSSLVLSFLMQKKGMEHLQKEILENSILVERNVCFPMI